MDGVINLSNNYYVKIENNPKSMPMEITNIKNLNIANIIKKEKLILKIDFKDLNRKEYRKLLKKLLYIKQKLSKRNVEIGIKEESKILLGYILNYNEKSKEQKEFISAIDAIFYNTRFERYNYIYDTVCDYLDSYFYGKNLCDFKNNKCGEKRNTDSTIGCCRHYKNKLLGPLLTNNLIPCEHLKEDYTCGAKCLGCKLFTCDYLVKKGIKFRIKDILLLDVFFNPLQKYFIKTMVFTPKEKIIKRLMIT